jgi:predicted aspartyl protease
MPQMTLKFDPTKGPIIEVIISHPVSFLRPGDPIPSMPVLLLVDTGAKSTFIDKRVAMALSLPSRTTTHLHTGTGAAEVNVYIGDLAFPAMSISWSDFRLPELPNSLRYCSGVLGRDVLNAGTLYYDGINNEITLTL